jgi:hypothetical protein
MRAPIIALLLVGLALPAGGVPPGSARAQGGVPRPLDDVQLQPIGKIISASGSFTVTHGSGVLLQASVGTDAGLGQAKVGDALYQHDVIETGTDGTVGFALNDGTAFNVSAKARIALDEFVYEPKGAANSALIKLTKGTFTFIAGKVSTTGDMKVETPVATMGVRGTAPRVAIEEDGSVRISTLVEGYLRDAPDKGRAPVQPGKRAAPADQRQAKNDAAMATVAQAIKDQSRAIAKKLNICRGC